MAAVALAGFYLLCKPDITPSLKRLETKCFTSCLFIENLHSQPSLSVQACSEAFSRCSNISIE